MKKKGEYVDNSIRKIKSFFTSILHLYGYPFYTYKIE